jgi:CRISPR/Cas system-associated exonuclease Cas4 (RecB family)
MSKAPRITGAWSPSKFSCYEQCPRQAKYKYIDKLPEPGSEAMNRGSRIHAEAEDYITGRKPKMTEDLKGVAPLLRKLKKGYKDRKVRVELALGLNQNWEPLPDWFHPDTWLRMKIDVVHFISEEMTRIIDWKTGRFKPEEPAYNDQLNLYAAAALSAGFGKATVAHLVFTDHGQTIEREAGKLTELTAPGARKDWERRVKRMFDERKFPARPGNYCRWCAFSTNKGGPCEF